MYPTAKVLIGFLFLLSAACSSSTHIPDWPAPNKLRMESVPLSNPNAAGRHVSFEFVLLEAYAKGLDRTILQTVDASTLLQMQKIPELQVILAKAVDLTVGKRRFWYWGKKVFPTKAEETAAPADEGKRPDKALPTGTALKILVREDGTARLDLLMLSTMKYEPGKRPKRFDMAKAGVDFRWEGGEQKILYIPGQKQVGQETSDGEKAVEPRTFLAFFRVKPNP